MPFGMWTWGNPQNHISDEGLDPSSERDIFMTGHTVTCQNMSGGRHIQTSTQGICNSRAGKIMQDLYRPSASIHRLLLRFASRHWTGNDLQEDPTTLGSEPLNRIWKPLNIGPSYVWKKSASREHWRSVGDTATLKKSMPLRERRILYTGAEFSLVGVMWTRRNSICPTCDGMIAGDSARARRLHIPTDGDCRHCLSPCSPECHGPN